MSATSNKKSIDSVVSTKPAWLNVRGWGAFIGYLRNNPEDAKVVWDEYGLLPLHVVCYFNAPSEVIQELLDIYPEAAYAKSNTGVPPIYDLLDGKHGSPSADSVKIVIEANHNALGTWITNGDGHSCLPVISAFLSDLNTPEVFQLVFNATPEREHAKIILWACREAKTNHQEKMEIILKCVDSNVLGISDDLGRLALHLACNNSDLSDDFVLALHDKCPSAAYVRDSEGNCPNLISRFKSKLESQDSRLQTYNQKVEGLAIGMALSDTARQRDENELNATKSCLEEKEKRIQQLEQELDKLKESKRAKN